MTKKEMTLQEAVAKGYCSYCGIRKAVSYLEVCWPCEKLLQKENEY